MMEFENDKVYMTEEPTAWFRTTCQARMREIIPIVNAAPEDVKVVLTPLVEPPEDMSDEMHRIWDRTCDRCGTYVANDGQFFTGQQGFTHEPTGKMIVITYGLCVECAGKEVV